MEKGSNFERARRLGRPPNIKSLFGDTPAFLVSGRYMDRAALEMGGAMILAANARNPFVLRGVLAAAQRANAALIVEIARSEGGASAYCAISLWNLAMYINQLCIEMNITVPVAIHADHFGIKKQGDIGPAKIEIPSLFNHGITSIAVDASHLPDDENLLANLALWPYVPEWAGKETEIGEIKGSQGLSTVEEALFLIQGLNAHNVFPEWIALNNGTTHGIEANALGIQVGLTAEIHAALLDLRVSGAQHGTSGNSDDRLKEIAGKTRTTKANVATAFQFASMGVELDDYGNANLKNGIPVKLPGEGVSIGVWSQMLAHAEKEGLIGGGFKKLNLPYTNMMLGQCPAVKKRMARRVEEFAYHLMTGVFGCSNSASIVEGLILEAGSCDPGSKIGRIEDPKNWTPEMIAEKVRHIDQDKGREGDFSD